MDQNIALQQTPGHARGCVPIEPAPDASPATALF